MTLHFLNDVANDAESTQKTENYVIIASLAKLTSVLKALPGKLDIKRHSPGIRYVFVIMSHPGGAMK